MKLPYKLNLVAVAILLGGGALLCVGVHFVHGYQVRSNAESLLVQAAESEEQKDPRQAANYLGQYLGMVPSDTDALARYGMLLDGMAKSPRDRMRPFFLLEQALRQDESRDDVRRRVVQIALALGRFKDAREHLRLLTESDAVDADLLHWQALCEVGEGKFDRAAGFYKRAVGLAPDRPALALEYANLLRFRLESPKDATRIVKQLVEAAPRSEEARLGAARFFQSVGENELAEQSVRFAFEELKLQTPEVFLLAADVARSGDRKGEAAAFLRRGRELHPKAVGLNLTLARQEFDAGKREEALRLALPFVETLPSDENELWLLCNLLIDLGRHDETEAAIRRLREGRRRQAWAADYLEARLLMGRASWGEARAKLEGVRAGRLPPASLGQTELLLAQCHERLGNPEQQLDAARRAMAADPGTTFAARRSAASALAALGKPEEALAEYAKLAAIAAELNSNTKTKSDATAKLVAAVNREMARLWLARSARQPQFGRWEEFDQLLKGEPESETELLRAEALASRGKPDEARALAEVACKRDPKLVEPWLFLAALARRPMQPKKPLEVLDEAERQAGRRVEWCLARASYWASTRGDGMRDALKKLEAEAERFGESDRARLLRGLGQARMLVGDPAGAARLWKKLAGSEPADRPADLGVRTRLLELAYQARESSEVEKLLAQVRLLEGGDGPVTAYGEAARQMLRVRARGDKEALALARKHLRHAGELRPSWAAVPLMEAEAAEADGKFDKALEKYLAALERGEARVAVLKRVFQLMAAQGQLLEAQALMRKIPEAARAAAGLDRMAAEIDLRGTVTGEDAAASRKRALETARKSVAEDSKRYEDYSWLGHMALLAGEDAEAENAFRRALDLNDKVPDTWAPYLLLLARTDPKRAEAELTKAEKRLQGPMPLVLASVYETLGRPDRAEDFYAAALRAKPADPSTLGAVAGFYSRTGARDKAQRLLREILAPGSGASEAATEAARRSLVLELAVGGNYAQFKEALDLVKGASIDDRRTRALVLATRPERGREAVALFRDLSDGRTGLTPEARFVLARLYESDGNWGMAERTLLELLRDQPKNSFYLAYYVRALLRHSRAADAEPYLERLAAANDRPFEASELKARVLYAADKKEEAYKEAQKAAKAKGARPDRAALLFEQLGRPEEAEKLLRAFVAGSKDPRAPLLLAQHLARRGSVAEAVRLCGAAWRGCPPELVAQVSLAVVREPKADEAQRAEVATRLREAADKAPQSTTLLVVLAALQDLRGKHDEAIAGYRAALEQPSKSVLALNNLAYLLALKGGHQEEAIELIDRAIDEQGPHVELLDTKGVACMMAKRTDLARQLLRQAVEMEPSASKYLHLAQACDLAGDRREALAAYGKAKGLDLTTAVLHRLEKPAIDELIKRMEKAKD